MSRNVARQKCRLERTGEATESFEGCGAAELVEDLGEDSSRVCDAIRSN